MKKLLIIVGILFFFLIAAMIMIPFIFKDEIKQTVKNATNENLNAQVDFDNVDLSLFRSFPNLAIAVENLSIVNNAPFEGDTVFSANTIGVSIDIISLIKGDVLKINSIFLDSPKIIMYVLEDGSANYNIGKDVQSKEESSTPVDSLKSQFNIELKNYSITNGRIAFIDQMSDMLLAVDNLDHNGSGDFSQDDFILETETSIDALTLEMDGIKYLNKVKTSLDMELGINIPNMKFSLKYNELSLNNLLLKFDGEVEMPGNDISLNLNFSSPRSDFKDIISLIPAIYKSDFSDIKTSGKMELKGIVQGVMSENKLPSFNLDLVVSDGNFQYPDLPTPVNNVNLSLNVSNKDGIIDNTIVDLSNIHLELGSDPIDGRLVLKNPESGPNVETRIKGKINLANVKNALDLKDIKKLEGLLVSDFEAKGNISSASNNYENMNAKGSISISNVIYEGSDGTQIINVDKANLDFTPRNIRLDNLSAKIGKSDVSASGTLKNLISYILSDGILTGNLNLKSNFFDFNPYLTSEESTEKSSEGEHSKTAAFDIPGNINFTMQSNFKKLLYDNLDLSNVSGQIVVKNNKVSLNNLKMNLLQGSLSGNGYYAKSEYQENPDINFNLNVKDFNIKQTYDKFISVKQFAPIAKYIQGNFSSNLKMNTSLDNSLTPVWETFFSDGLLNLKTAEIKDFKPFTTVGSLLSLQELSNPKLQNVKPKFEIKNGRFYVSPIKYKIGKYDIVLSGSNGIDQSLDYIMEIDIPAEQVKNQANNAIGNLVGKDLNLIKSGTVKVKALIGGTINSPKVKTTAADVASGVVEQVQDAIVAEAKAQADSLKAAAEQKIKAEAKKKEEDLKKKLEKEAKKKLKKLFKLGGP